MENITIAEFFGVLRQSVVETWGTHLTTMSYAKHMALNEFYDEMLELVDNLIECYQGIYGILPCENSFEFNCDNVENFLTNLRDFIIDNRERLFNKRDSELWSETDSILSCIDKTLYKIRCLVK